MIAQRIAIGIGGFDLSGELAACGDFFFGDVAGQAFQIGSAIRCWLVAPEFMHHIASGSGFTALGEDAEPRRGSFLLLPPKEDVAAPAITARLNGDLVGFMDELGLLGAGLLDGGIPWSAWAFPEAAWAILGNDPRTFPTNFDQMLFQAVQRCVSIDADEIEARVCSLRP